MKNTKITWTQEERDLLTAKAALIYQARGFGYGPSVIQAQNIWLAPNRRRPEGSISVTAAKQFKAGINAILAESNKVASAVAKLPEESVESIVIRKAQEVETLQPLQVAESTVKTEVSIDSMIEGIAADFKTKLLARLSEVAKEAIEEVLSGVDSKKATDTDFKQKPKYNREKIGYIGGGQRKSDLVIAKEGLEDVYQFYFVDSLAQLDRLKDCSVIVQAGQCSHPLMHAAKRLSPNAKWIRNVTPKEANSQLLNRFVEGPLGMAGH